MKEMDKYRIEKALHQRAEEYESTFDPQDWVAMEALLEESEDRPLVWWFGGKERLIASLLLAGGLVIVALSLMLWLNRPTRTATDENLSNRIEATKQTPVVSSTSALENNSSTKPSVDDAQPIPSAPSKASAKTADQVPATPAQALPKEPKPSTQQASLEIATSDQNSLETQSSTKNLQATEQPEGLPLPQTPMLSDTIQNIPALPAKANTQPRDIARLSAPLPFTPLAQPIIERPDKLPSHKQSKTKKVSFYAKLGLRSPELRNNAEMVIEYWGNPSPVPLSGGPGALVGLGTAVNLTSRLALLAELEYGFRPYGFVLDNDSFLDSSGSIPELERYRQIVQQGQIGLQLRWKLKSQWSVQGGVGLAQRWSNSSGPQLNPQRYPQLDISTLNTIILGDWFQERQGFVQAGVTYQWQSWGLHLRGLYRLGEFVRFRFAQLSTRQALEPFPPINFDLSVTYQLPF